MNSLKEDILLLSGRANPSLSISIAAEIGLPLCPCRVETFPDNEIYVQVRENMIDKDVYLIQSTGPPAAHNLLELLLLADACRRGGAGRISGIIPYLGYSRQERRVEEGEPLSARLMADLLAARLDRVICVDLHNPAVEGFFPIPVIHLSSLPLLAKRLEDSVSDRTVIVAPDLGAVKLARAYADRLDLPAVFIHKERRSTGEVVVRNVIGEVKGRAPVLVDDMISSGGTVTAAVDALLKTGADPEITVAAAHGLFAGTALEDLGRLSVSKIIVTDSVETASAKSQPVETVSLGNVLAETIRRLAG